MLKVNVMLAKNHLFKFLFSLNTFKNVSNFKSEFIKRYIVPIFLFYEKEKEDVDFFQKDLKKSKIIINDNKISQTNEGK